MFSHQKSVKKAFFVIQPPPRRSCLAKIRVSCQTFKMDIEKSFFNPQFWPFKNNWTGQKSCFLIRRVLKSLFVIQPPPRGSCLAKIRVSCQTFKIDMERSFSLTPHFLPFKNNWTGQKSCFLIRRVLKSLFCYTTSPRGSCFAKIRVSCQTCIKLAQLGLHRCSVVVPEDCKGVKLVAWHQQ